MENGDEADTIDEWLAEMARDHGPIPAEALEWAAQIVDQWTIAQPGQSVPNAWSTATDSRDLDA